MALRLQYATNNIPETAVKEARSKEFKPTVTHYPLHHGGGRGKGAVGSGRTHTTGERGWHIVGAQMEDSCLVSRKQVQTEMSKGPAPVGKCRPLEPTDTLSSLALV